jgi:DNA-binding NarL/FixJ family response regulator
MNSIKQHKPDIIIVDDHLIFRQGLKAIINFENIGSIIGEASNGEDFLELIKTLKPDIVLMDIDMPQMNGFEATQKALALIPGLKIIAFTVFAEKEYFDRMIAIGAKGFILKSDGFNVLENAISIVMKGENYFIDNSEKVVNNKKNIPELKEIYTEKVDNSIKKGKMVFFPWMAKQNESINK